MNTNRMDKSCMKRQAKIINNLMDSDCPRLNNNSSPVLVRTDLPRHFEPWPAVKITLLPGASPRNPRNMKPCGGGDSGSNSRNIKPTGGGGDSGSNSRNIKPSGGGGDSGSNFRNMKQRPKPRLSGFLGGGDCGSNSRNLKPRQKPRLSGFFQAQLRMRKSRKLMSNGLQLRKSRKLMSNGLQLRTVEKTKIDLINCGGFPILKRHGNVIEGQFGKNRLHIDDLSKDLLTEILVRLPVKYILRCRSVQKSWNYLIQSPVFISLQLNYQKQIIAGNNNHHYPKYLLFKDERGYDVTVRFDDVQCEEYYKFEVLPGLPDDDCDFFAQSYGLICMSTLFYIDPKYIRKIYLWNPLVKKYKTLPEPHLPSRRNCQAWDALAFGFLPEVDDYVVIHIIKPCLRPHPHSVIIGVYSLKTNSWKISSQNYVFISEISSNPDDVVFINGVAFWVGVNSDEQRILMCFETKTEILCEISLPDWVAYRPDVPIIHQFGQSIAYFVWKRGVNHFDMWVLKYDRMNEFMWEKKMCVSPSKDVEEHVLGVRNNGDPILETSYNLISYSLDHGFVESWGRWTPDSPCEEGDRPLFVIMPFVESLVMLND